MTKLLNTGVSRRAVLADAAAGAAALAMPHVVRAQDKTLKVGVYGGYFKDSFDKHIFPEFTKASGIAVESIAEPTGEAWLVQLQQAAQANVAPADVSMMSQVSHAEGHAGRPLGAARPGEDPELHATSSRNSSTNIADGRVAGVGAVTWYITLVSNTDSLSAARRTPGPSCGIRRTPTSSGCWRSSPTRSCWRSPRRPSSAATREARHRRGHPQVMDKIAELKPNVKLWYRDEAQFEQALKSGEIPMGQYYHDVTGPRRRRRASRCARPSRRRAASTMPARGWCRSASAELEEAHVFIDYMSQAGDPGAAVAQGRHVADGEARGARSDRRGIRRGLLRHPADHPALRSLPDEVGLAEPEVDRADRRGMS